MKTGLFIGRFQPFHKGHLDALKQVLGQMNFIKIVIGSSNKKRTKDNPLTYTERKKYIQSVLPFKQYTIYPVPDVPSDNAWIKNVRKTVGHFDHVFLTKNDWVEGILQDHKIPYSKTLIHIPISATAIRDRIRKDNKSYKKYLLRPLSHKLLHIIQTS